jgi:hypothetical protein
MLHASFEPGAKVLRLTFSGSLTTDDVDAIDPLIARVMVERNCVHQGVRTLYDMRALEALAVPSSRFAERAGLPPIGKLTRVVVAPPWANGGDFGRSYRDAQAVYSHSQPTIVPTLLDAYRLLSVVDPDFQLLGRRSIAADADERSGCIVHITRRGAAADLFGWEIIRTADGHEVARSARTFPTRVEALADSATAASSLVFDLDPDPRDYRHRA